MAEFDKRDKDVLEMYRQRLHDYWHGVGGSSDESDWCDYDELAQRHFAADITIDHWITDGLREYWLERHGQD